MDAACSCSPSFGKISPVNKRERTFIVNFAAGPLAVAVTLGLILADEGIFAAKSGPALRCGWLRSTF
jgi:hypothetical protein